MSECPHPACPMCRAKKHREENRRLKDEVTTLREGLRLATGAASRTTAGRDARVERALVTWNLKPWPHAPEANFARNNAIYMAIEAGESFKAVGKRFKLCGTRVKEVWLKQAKEKDLITVSFREWHADGVIIAKARHCLAWVAHRLCVPGGMYDLALPELMVKVEEALKTVKIEPGGNP